MKVIFLEWKSFGNEDILEAFEVAGYQVIRLPFSNKYPRSDKKLEEQLAHDILTVSPDYVFSFNYFPLVASACRKADIRYVSWIYDSPYVLLYSYTAIFPTNLIFVFDKELYMEFKNAGITTVHYLPMAANTARLNKMSDFADFSASPLYNQTPLAFVGSLYTEKHQFYERLDGISEYTRGYLEGIMSAQKQVYGYNFVEESLTPEILADMKNILPLEPNEDGVETDSYLFAQYVINRKITGMERMELLREIGSLYGLDLYTPDSSLSLKGVINHGPADYYTASPYIYKTALINLNISLRSIKSGIPLRAFDIMGAGGFLLTNFQSDFFDFFIPDEDFVFFDSRKDLLEKVGYYMNHPDEAKDISLNGHKKIVQAHTYLHRLNEIESLL